jgi:hypothetical protein
MSSKLVTSVAQTPALVDGLPGGIAEAVVLNSGSVDLVIDNTNDMSLDPQSGCRLVPGELMAWPAANGCSLVLYAVAAGPGGQVTVVI